MALYLLRETHVYSTQRVNDDQGHSSNNWDKNNAQITQNLELNVCSTMACIQLGVCAEDRLSIDNDLTS